MILDELTIQKRNFKNKNKRKRKQKKGKNLTLRKMLGFQKVY